MGFPSPRLMVVESLEPGRSGVGVFRMLSTRSVGLLTPPSGVATFEHQLTWCSWAAPGVLLGEQCPWATYNMNPP